MDKVILYILHISLVKDNLSFISSFVDEDRKEKIERLTNENDRLLSLGAGYLLKKYLPSSDIKISDSGKSYLPQGPYFNISHSREYVVLAIHPSSEVGADIERIDEKRIDGIRFTLNEEEKGINDINTLFRIWTNKESLVKCIGSGIKDIKKVDGLPLEGKRLINNEEYYVKSIIYDEYSLSVTINSEPVGIIINRIESI